MHRLSAWWDVAQTLHCWFSSACICAAGHGHSDLAESPTLSCTGRRYVVSYVDDYSNFSMVYFLARKSDQEQAFDMFKSWAETHTGRKIKLLHCDRGGEYMSNKFKARLQAYGLSVSTTCFPIFPTVKRQSRAIQSHCVHVGAFNAPCGWYETGLVD